MTDGTKLVQMLSNLINNALKFTPEGRIDIGYVLQDGFLVFSVKDTGLVSLPNFIPECLNVFIRLIIQYPDNIRGQALDCPSAKHMQNFLAERSGLNPARIMEPLSASLFHTRRARKHQ